MSDEIKIPDSDATATAAGDGKGPAEPAGSPSPQTDKVYTLLHSDFAALKDREREKGANTERERLNAQAKAAGFDSFDAVLAAAKAAAEAVKSKADADAAAAAAAAKAAADGDKKGEDPKKRPGVELLKAEIEERARVQRERDAALEREKALLAKLAEADDRRGLDVLAARLDVRIDTAAKAAGALGDEAKAAAIEHVRKLDAAGLEKFDPDAFFAEHVKAKPYLYKPPESAAGASKTSGAPSPKPANGADGMKPAYNRTRAENDAIALKLLGGR